MDAVITDIKRFAIHDGPGIRTTVFFKGCPLNCLWCHNPEAISYGVEPALFIHKCISCGECVQVCENHRITGGEHRFSRESCRACGRCGEVCPQEAMKLYGSRVPVEELLSVLMADRVFFESSGGGVTLSGGECLTQGEACLALLQALKSRGIHTAVDTCGYVSREILERVISCTDLFLYDLKAMDEEVHIRCTGKSNTRILENLRYLDARGAKTEIRIPFVPGYNDDQVEKMGVFLSGLSGLTGVRVLPYHSMAGSKYEALSMKNTLPAAVPRPEEVERAKACLRSHGLTVR